MESELLEPCPVCGRGCEVVEGDDETGGVFCACGYRLDDEEMKGIAEDAIARHNTLARRAEIGRIVEEIVDGPDAEIHVRRLMDSYVVARDDERDDKLPWTGESPTLLEALRALAAELEVSGE